MHWAGFAIIFFLGALIIWIIYTYNRFVGKQAAIDTNWDEVDTHLKLRHDLIPNLIGAEAGRMPAERALFARIEEIRREIAARAGGPESPIDSVERLENELSGLMLQIREAAAKYPEVMMDQKFITLLGELVSMEGRAASACNRHNQLVRDFNGAITQFPANLVVGFLHFHPCEMRIFGKLD